jgi:hypothetical protein
LNIDELSMLKKIEYINLSWNKNLNSLTGIEDHSEILEAYIGNDWITKGIQLLVP